MDLQTALCCLLMGLQEKGEEGKGRLEAYLLDLGVSMHNHPHGMKEPIKLPSASVAPEMEQGSGAFDGSADVWGWGVLLWALLSWSMDGVGRYGHACGTRLSRPESRADASAAQAGRGEELVRLAARAEKGGMGGRAAAGGA